MRFNRLAVMTVLCAPLVAAFSPGLNNNRQKAAFPPKQRDNNINKNPVGPLNVGEEVSEVVKIVDLNAVFLFLAPAVALSAGLVAQLQKGKLNEQVESTEEDLEKIKNQIKSTESAITTSTAVTIASAGFVAVNALGLLPNSFAPDGSSAPVASIATPQETIVEKASMDAKLAAAPRQEEEGVFADDDAAAEGKASTVTEEEEGQAEETTNPVSEMGAAEQMPSASSEETKQPIADDKPVVVDEEQKPSVGEASTPPASDTPTSESVFDNLMKKLEITGKVVDDASTPPASETPKSENVFDELMKKTEMAGKASMDGVETAKEKPVDEFVSAKPVESVEEIAKPEGTSAEITPPVAKSSDSVFDDLMKKMEVAGKAGAENVEAAKEKVAEAIENAADALSGAGEDVESEAVGAVAASIPKLQVRIPEFAYDLKNIDPVALQGAAVLSFGAIAAAAVIAASDSGGTGSTFAPGTKAKGTGYLDGLTRSSASLASKGTKGPTSYLDKLKTPSSAMSSARTGAGAGSSYLDAISPKSSATKKSYSFSGKKPIKTGRSESPLKTLAPSGSYKAAPASPTTSQPAVTLLPEKVAEPPALAPLATSSQLSGSSAAPKKTFSPYGKKPQSTVGAGSMGSSSSYLSNMSSSGATFVSPSVAPSWSPAPSPPPATTATVTTSATSQAATKASYSPFGKKPELTGTGGSSSSYLSGMDAANGAGISYSSGPSLPPPPSPPTSYVQTSQATPKTSYSPFGGSIPKSIGNAGAMGSSSSYLTGMGTNGTNGASQSQPAYSPPSPSPPPAEPARQSSTANPSKSYAPMKGKPKAVARAGPGSYLDAL